jgi:sugar lactone lactonase YvrE
VANTGDNTISILRNSGSLNYGTAGDALLAKIDLPAGANPQSLASTDLDGDGKPELIIANAGDNSIWVYPNIAVSGSISAASFGPKMILAAGSAPIQVVTGDIDDDGKPDLMVINNGAANISVFRNTSAGSLTFAARADLPTPLVPLHLSLGDLDGDGRVDAALSWANSTKLSLFRNTSTPGTLNFDTNTDLDTGSPVTFSAIADLNQDGITDVIAGSTAANMLYIFRNHLITPPPVITSFSPQQGVNGATVIIAGTNLNDATAVSFGGVAAASFTVNSPTQITAVVGTGATGMVSVITPAGTAELPGFTSQAKPAFAYAGPNVYKKGAAITPLAPQHTGGEVSDYTVTGQIVAGQPVNGFKDAAGTTAQFDSPAGLAMDKNGNFYVADKLNCRIRKITPAGVVSTFAGKGYGSADGPANVAEFNQPTGLAIDAAGNLYVADAMNNKIRKISPAGEVSTLAGSGLQGAGDGPGATATFYNPTGVAVDAAGNVFVADRNNAILRKITPDGMVSTYSGSRNNWGSLDGPVSQATYTKPYCLTIDKQGNMFVTDGDNNSVRVINPQQTITTLGHFFGPRGVGADAAGNLYITTDDRNVQKMSPSGKITIESSLYATPEGILVAPNGTVYFNDNNSLKKLVYSPAYTITPALPAGLDFDAATGTITGIATSASPQTTYQITAGNAAGSSTASVTISVIENNEQPPVITSFTPLSGPLGTTITISGTGFSATAANNIVYFGATKGMVAGGDTKQLLVIVPAGTTYSLLSVLNTETGLVAYSAKPFTVTFPSTHKIEPDDFEPKVEFKAGFNTRTLAVSDLDGDGKADIVVTDWDKETVAVYLNTTNGDGINAQSFTPPVLFDTGIDPWQVTAGDLDGDGKQDLVVVNYSTNYISIYRNTSTKGNISFAPRVDFFSGINPITVAIGDLDADGKPEIVVGNSISKTVSIFKNFTATGNISAESFVREMDIPAGPQPSDIQLADMDGDGKPDIVYSNGNTDGFNIMRNKATRGSLSADSFYPSVAFPGAGEAENITIGDLDLDGKPDVVVSNMFSGTISVYRNISTSGGINAGSIAAPVSFPAPFPEDVEMGDIDGDGKPDLAISNSGQKSISILRNNTSGPGINSNSFYPKLT